MNRTCEATLQPSGDRCGKPVTHRVEFKDESDARTCQGCALRLQQTAGAHGAQLKVEKLP